MQVRSKQVLTGKQQKEDFSSNVFPYDYNCHTNTYNKLCKAVVVTLLRLDICKTVSAPLVIYHSQCVDVIHI